MKHHASIHKARWFVARVAPNREAVAQEFLRQEGVTTFLPLRPAKVRHNRHCKGRRKTRYVCELPGYLFLKTGTEIPIGALSRCKPFRSLLGYKVNDDIVPAMIDYEYMERWVWRSGAGLVGPVAESKWLGDPSTLKPGDLALVTDGPYEGNTVEIEAMPDTGYAAKVLLPILGTIRPADIDISRLSPVAA